MVLEKSGWYISLKRTVKAALPEGSLPFRLLNTFSGVAEAENKVFAIKEALYFPKYGQTFLNKSQHDAFTRLSKFLGDRKVDLVDIGARHGWFGNISPRFFNVRNYYAYEPLTDCNLFLDKIRYRFEEMQIRNVLLGNAIGEKLFYQYAAGGNSSTRKFHSEFEAPVYDNNSVVAELKKTETTLERDLQDQKADLSLPLLLKIDTQGSELEILTGAKRLFADGKITAVVVEMQTQPIYENQKLWTEILAFFEQQGFVLLDLIPGLRCSDGTINELDGIFVKRLKA